MLCEQQAPQQAVEQTQPSAAAPQAPRYFVPQVDVVELPQEFVLTADLPGAVAETIDVDYVDGELRLHAPVAPRKASGRYLLEEYAVGGYRRTFRLGKSIDASRISADYEGGVLTLRLPKLERVKPRKIAVEAS